MKRIIMIMIIVGLISCNLDKQKTDNQPITNLFQNNEKLEDDYIVLNQTLSQLNEFRLCLCNYTRLILPPEFKESDTIPFDKTELAFLDTIINKRKLKLRTKDFYFIELVAISDSLSSFKYNGYIPQKSIFLDISKLNSKPDCILLKRKHELYKYRRERDDEFFPSVSISRVIFNEDKSKAVYSFGATFGGLNGHGYNVFCEFENGAWKVVDIEDTWIS